MRTTCENTRKSPYTTPQLTVHGRLEELTKQTNKALGGNDGITFMQQPVHWTS